MGTLIAGTGIGKQDVHQVSVESTRDLTITVATSGAGTVVTTAVKARGPVLEQVLAAWTRLGEAGDDRLVIGDAGTGRRGVTHTVIAVLPAGVRPIDRSALDPVEALAIVADAAAAVASAHAAGVRHGGLALRHLLLGEDRVYVLGMGLTAVRARAGGTVSANGLERADVAALGRLLTTLVSSGIVAEQVRDLAADCRLPAAERPTAAEVVDRLETLIAIATETDVRTDVRTDDVRTDARTDARAKSSTAVAVEASADVRPAQVPINRRDLLIRRFGPALVVGSVTVTGGGIALLVRDLLRREPGSEPGLGAQPAGAQPLAGAATDAPATSRSASSSASGSPAARRSASAAAPRSSSTPAGQVITARRVLTNLRAMLEPAARAKQVPAVVTGELFAIIDGTLAMIELSRPVSVHSVAGSLDTVVATWKAKGALSPQWAGKITASTRQLRKVTRLQ